MKWSYIRWIFPSLRWLRLYVWIVWEIPFIQGDSSHDLLIPKRWRSRFTFERVTRITIPKRSQSQNCQVFIIYFHHISHHIVFSPSFSIFHKYILYIYIFIFISAGKNDRCFFSTTPIHQKFFHAKVPSVNLNSSLVICPLPQTLRAGIYESDTSTGWLALGFFKINHEKELGFLVGKITSS